MDKENRGITGSTLKLFAVIFMLVDHIGAIIIQNGILADYMGINVKVGIPITKLILIDDIRLWVIVYLLCRAIGRLAFPIFSFLLVEGFVHTGNRSKYIFRLFLFALISEMPFDFGLYGVLWHWEANNVFITLSIAMLVLAGLEKIKTKHGIIKLIVIIAGVTVTNLLNSDFATSGVLLTSVLYILREKPTKRTVFGSIIMLWGLTAPFSFIFINLYNGKRGVELKYFFYLFYPLHLVVLGAIISLK